MENLSQLKGVTPKRLENLKKMGILKLSDLVSYLPKSYADYSHLNTLDEVFQTPEKRLFVRVKALSCNKIPTRSRIPLYKIQVQDSVAKASLLSFGYQNRQLKPGSSEYYLISGVFKYRMKSIECSQFTVEGIIQDSEELEDTTRQHAQIVPFYPLGAGITQNLLRSFIKQGLFVVKPHLRENIPPYLIQKYHYLSRWESLYQMHFPKDFETLELARERLKYTELFRLQFHFALKQHYFKNTKPRTYTPPFEKTAKLISSLPFSLTQDQLKTLEEIQTDLLSPRAMHRLLMGDVGSGKTLVALLSLLKVVENGYQGVFLAPTEVLAKQHFQTFTQYISPFDCKIDLLTGSTKPLEKREILISLHRGETQILVGTHAVFSDDIRFSSLGMVVIDEQHKFGVKQRMDLVKKGISPDVLVMSATPIPRTLGYVQFGDMDISIISHKPEGRLPIATKWLEESEIQVAYDAMRAQIQKGHQGYIVYPLVEESEKSSRKSVLEGFSFLKKHIFSDLRLTLLHGQMSEQEKNLGIREFQRGETDILVSTIVIEVGIDVPNATCLIIENASYFGLSSLHQLRGRVGRAKWPSQCFLITPPKSSLSLEGVFRMESMVEHQDGFLLAQKDMELRGMGNFVGKNQSGASGLKLSHIFSDQKILEQARQDAFHIMQTDPSCEDIKHRELKPLIQKFENEIQEILHN